MLMKFTSHGYSYTDVDGTVFYEEDKNHYGLFNFLAVDLTNLPRELESYFSKIIDLKTLKLKDYKPTPDDLSKIDNILYGIHPYFEFISSEEINDAIGDYFNALLIQNSYNQEDYSYSPIYDKEWYLETCMALFPESFFDKNKMALNFYNIYLSTVKPDDDDEPPYVKLPPEGFNNLISLQDHFRSMVFWMLDASAPYLNKLSIPERAWVYGSVHSTMSDQPHMVVTKQISFADPHRRSYSSNYSRLEYIDGVDCHFTLFGDLRNFHNNQENIHPEAINVLKSIVKAAKEGFSEGIYEEYEVSSLYEVLLLEIYHMILDNTLVKKCRNCEKYFVVKNLNVEYCDRRINDDEELDDYRTCSDVGPKLSYQRKLEEDLPLKLYSRSYKTHYARIKSGKMTQGQFFEWQQEAKAKLEEVRAGSYEFEDFKKWLKK